MATQQLLSGLGPRDNHVRRESTPHSLWQGVSASRVLDFLGKYEAISTPSFFYRCEALHRYINEQVARNELSEWTIAVIGKWRSRQWTVGEFEFATVTRDDRGDGTRFITGAVVGSAEEALDLSQTEWNEAMAASSPTTSTGGVRVNPERKRVREVRPASRGLLLIYPVANSSEGVPIPAIALSFPTSDTAKALSYRVNRIWVEQRGLFTESDE
jgi:hypothetical protein